MPAPSMEFPSYVQVGRYKGDVFGLDKLKQVGPEIVQAIKGAAELWVKEQGGNAKVIITDVGRRKGDLGNHSAGYAADVQLVDSSGRMVPRRFSKGTDYRKYEQFWQDGLAYAMSIYGPEVEKHMRTGAYFLNRVGNDPMHADIRRRYQPGVPAGAGGNLREGANAAMRGMYPGIVSQGITGGDWLSYGKSRFGPQYQFGSQNPANTDFFNGRNTQVEKLNAALVDLTAIEKLIAQKAITAGLDPTVMLGLAKRESQLDPNASNKDARGLWQFTTGTGKDYGLMSEADRKNVEKSTDAAMVMFKDLMALLDGNLRHVLAAWNIGGTGTKRLINQGKDPEKYTEGPHVQRILEYRKQYEAKLQGALPNIMDSGDIKKQNKAFEEVLNQQFDAYGKHLQRLEDERAAYNTVDLAQQRTQMEKLEAQREQMRKADEAAMAVAQGSGNMDVVRQASATAAQHEIKFLKEKNDLLLKGMQIEYDAMAARKGRVQQQIADAQKNGGDAALAAIPDLRSESKQLDAQMKALAEQRKQLEIKANAEIVAATRQAEDDKRKAYRETADIAVEVERNRREAAQVDHDQAKQRADDFVAMQQQRIEGLQAEFAVQKELANISAEAFSQYADQQRGAIDLSLERAKAEFEGRDAQRQAMLEGKEGIDAIVQSRENLNARLQDQLNLLQQERDATVKKLELSAQELEYQKRISEWQLQRTSAIEPNDELAKLAIKKQIADLEAQITANLQAQEKANAALAREQAKAQGDAMRQGQRLDTQEVKESQLRMNAFWDQYMGRLRDYASIWQEITGDTQDGFTQMALASAQYAESIQQIGQKYKDITTGKETAWAKSLGDMAPMMEGLEQGQAALAAMAKTMLGLRRTLKEGSDAYNNMTVAAGALMRIQQAMQIVEGVLAVIHQLSAGEVYTAIPRAMAVAGMVASMGVNTGASASASGGYTASGPQDGTKSGVFGDSEAKSDSINKSLEIVAANSTADLDYSKGMLRSLKNIELSIGGVTNSVIRNVSAVVPDNQKLGFQRIGSGLFANMEKYISDFGIASWGQKLTTIIKSGFQGNVFTDITREVKVFGNTFKKEVRRKFSALDSDVADQFTRTIVGIAESVQKAGKVFGLSAEDFNDRIRGFVINLGSVSLQGLKGEDLQKAISAMFSGAADSIARQVMPGLDDFAQIGEGAYQTMMRVANGIQTAEGMLAQLGMTSIKYTDIIYKQGNVTEEIIRQSILAVEGMSGIGRYMSEVVASAEEMVKVYQDLLLVSDAAALAGFNINHLSDALVVASGGVARFLSNLQTYQTDILGGSSTARDMLALTRGFERLGIAVPKSNEEFVKLVNSISTGTEAGQQLYAQVLSLAGAFVKAQEAAKKLEELRSKYLPTDSLTGYRNQIAQVAKDFKDIIEGTLATLPGGGKYLKRTSQVTSLNDRIDDRTDERAMLQEEIDVLEAKGKLTLKERQRLAVLRKQRKDLTDEIAGYQKQIDKLNALIRKDPKSAALIDERAKLLEEQGDAIIKTLADIWDQMTQAINAAKQTLISINDSIFEFTASSSAPDIKLGMMTARAETAGKAYFNYGGNDINELNKFADAYYKAIMDEYQAKLDFIEAPKKALEKERELAEKAHQEKIDALQKELDKVRELADAVAAIKKFALDMKLGPQSTLNPRAQLLEAQKQYEDLLKRSQGGDVKAMQELTGGADKYLEVAQKYFGGSKRYGEIFERVRLAMEEIGAIDVPDAVSIQDKIDQLNKDHEVYLKGIEDKIAALKIDEATKALQKETAEKLQKLADNFGPRITEAEDKAREDMKALTLEVTKGNTLSQAQLDALNAMLKNIGIDPVTTPTTPVAPSEPSLPAPTDDWVKNIFDRWVKDQTGYKAPLPAFASGGFAQPGWALVGEEGPELVKFGAQAQVYDAERTARMLREIASFQPVPKQAGRPINMEVMPRVIDDIRPKNNEPAKFYSDDVVAELRAVQREVKALVTTQSGANPQIIDKLANLDRRMESIERQQRIRV